MKNLQFLNRYRLRFIFLAGLILAVAIVLFASIEILHDFVANLKITEIYWSFSITITTTLIILITLYYLFIQRLRQREQEWDTMLEHAADAIFIYNQQTRCIKVNRAACEIFGYSVEEFLSFGMRDLVHPEDLKKLAQPEEQAKLQQLLQGKITINGQRRLRRKDGSYITVEINVKRLTDGRIISIKRDITLRELEDQKMRQLAFYDTLTQLPNRCLLNDRLQQTLKAGKRGGCFGALMFLDMDNFKPLNDMYGHNVGDLLLIEAARRIQLCVREADTVARFGGDEFIVLINELASDQSESISQAKFIANKIRQTLAEPYILSIQQDPNDITTIEHFCTTSIGVILLNQADTQPEDILKWADKAMYQAKDLGGNQICIFDEVKQTPGS